MNKLFTNLHSFCYLCHIFYTQLKVDLNLARLKIIAGIANDLEATEPEYTITFPYFNRQGGEYGMVGDGNEIELEADYFASCLLMPESIYKTQCNEFVDQFSFAIVDVLADYFKDEKGKFLQDIRTSKAVAEYIGDRFEMEMWRVGRAYAALKLREINGVFGGELAGHYYFKDFYYSDSGLMATLILLDVISEYKKKGVSLSQIISKIEAYDNSGEINFKIEQKSEAMEAVKDFYLNSEKPTAFYDFDGYRVEYTDWWFNIRPSNTEPYLRMLVEAKSKELLEKKVKEITEIIEKFH